MQDNNKNGFTLIELIVSIAVASIVLIILMQMLVMSVEMKNYTYTNSALHTESFLLAEEIKSIAFDHETQFVSLTETSTDITLTFIHRYDIEIDTQGVISWVDTPVSERNIEIVFEKDNHQFVMSSDGITYNPMHSSGVYFEYTTGQETTIDISSVTICDPYNPPVDEGGCEDVVITLTFFISIYQNGVPSDIQEFKTTIIV